MKNQVYLYLAKPFVEWEEFKVKLLEKFKTHFIFNFFFENRVFLK